MKDRNPPPTQEELIALLPTPGWRLKTDDKTLPRENSNLEELVRATHARHMKGEEPGLISRIENALELDLIQLQGLWAHLGLPM